jgi:hypothetical protein
LASRTKSISAIGFIQHRSFGPNEPGQSTRSHTIKSAPGYVLKEDLAFADLLKSQCPHGSLPGGIALFRSSLGRRLGRFWLGLDESEWLKKFSS